MVQPPLLPRVAAWLESARVPYMVVGSVASSFHGEPRTTRDIDLVIDPTSESLARLLELVPHEEFYLDAREAAVALAERRSFNIIESATGWKVDLMICRDRPFSREELARRLRVRLDTTDVYVATAEDTIIAKLEWSKAGESERQLRDVASMLARAEPLDHGYLDRWIAELDLTKAWSRAQSKADPGHGAP